MKKRFSEEQIIGFLREAEAGMVNSPASRARLRPGRHRTATRARLMIAHGPSGAEGYRGDSRTCELSDTPTEISGKHFASLMGDFRRNAILRKGSLAAL